MTIQTEFDAVRAAFPSRYGHLLRARIVILPRWMGWLAPLTGGAFIWWFWLVVDHRFPSAPSLVRRYILAHEWGHILRGHAVVLYFYWVFAAPAVFAIWGLTSSPSGAAHISPLVLLGPLSLCLALLCSSLIRSVRLEYEADAVAAEAVGPLDAPTAYQNAVAWSGRRWSPIDTRRLTALRRLAKSSLLDVQQNV